LDAQQFKNQYDQLMRSPLIERVTVNESKIIVHTNMIYAIERKSGGEGVQCVRRIGKFKIHIPISVSDGQRERTDAFSTSLIRFENQTPAPNGQQAPHVFPTGNACFGDYEREVHNLWIQRNFSQLILQLLHFLINAHHPGDQLGNGIVNWPVANEEEYRGKLAPY
jgi:hypothetical protein